MKRTYDWSKLSPPTNYIHVNLRTEQVQRVQKYLPFLIGRWNIPEQVIWDEVNEIRKDFHLSCWYLHGNDKRKLATEELSKIYNTLDSELLKKDFFKKFPSLKDHGEIRPVGRPKGSSSEPIQQEKLFIASLNKRLGDVIKSETERCLLMSIILQAAGIFNVADSKLKFIIDPGVPDKVNKEYISYMKTKVKKLLPKK